MNQPTSGYFAHSQNACGRWHPLTEHLSEVARLAGDFATGSIHEDEAALAGLLHDLGKYGDRFQARLQGKDSGLDHWSQGAWLALTQYRAVAAALAIQGHHIGLQYLNKAKLRELFQPHKVLRLESSESDLAILTQRLAADGLAPRPPAKRLLDDDPTASLGRMLDTRLLFSALVDADFLDTAAHFNGNDNGKVHRPEAPPLQAEQALSLLLEHMGQLEQNTGAAEAVRQVRKRLRQDCLAAAAKDTGLFTLTAPTGSGKTLAMLAFALAHAHKHGLRRVVVVIPYLSIIEQTAAIYRDIFEPHFGQAYLLEHHSLAGTGAEQNADDDEGQAKENERRRRLAAENWDAPLIVTTGVQLLESLFSNRPSACRKLHRLACSVILFDEAQTLPAALAVPTLAALSHLAHGHGGSVVFATATQPAFEHLHGAAQAHCAHGWQAEEIAADPPALFDPLQRTNFTWSPPNQVLPWTELAQRLRQVPQALCIVNLKRHAQTLWEAMQGDDAFHLSTNLCPAHRKDLLNTVRTRLKAGRQVYLIATQCIEAGVDVDFPMVFRACGPLEAIIQAAGRCNREGKLVDMGQVHVFAPELSGNESGYPDPTYAQAAQVTETLLRRHGPDGMRLDDPAFVTGYYRELYDIAKPEHAGKTRRIAEYVQAGAFPEIAGEYRLIQQDAINVVVPYEPCMALFRHLQDTAQQRGLTGEWIKQARPLAVSLFRPKPDDTVWDGLLPIQVNRRKRHNESDDWYLLANPEHYHAALGLRIPKGLNLWIG